MYYVYRYTKYMYLYMCDYARITLCCSVSDKQISTNSILE